MPLRVSCRAWRLTVGKKVSVQRRCFGHDHRIDDDVRLFELEHDIRFVFSRELALLGRQRFQYDRQVVGSGVSQRTTAGFAGQNHVGDWRLMISGWQRR
jgi:hypothetical protein